MNRPLHLFVLLAFAALLTQGFQCASSSVTVAKRAIQKKDYPAAKTALDEALATNPNDCEALVLMGDVNMQLADADGMIASYQKAQTCPELTPQQREEVSIKLYNSWVSQYNSGITKYNDYVKSKNAADLSAAATHLSNAEKLKPSFTEPIALLGQAQEQKGDTNSAYETYKRWWAIEKPGFDVVKEKGLTVNYTRKDLFQKLGTPLKSDMDSLSDGAGVIYRDQFDIGGREFYAFSAQLGSAADGTLEGWTYNPPSDLSRQERSRSRITQLNPLKALAFIEYARGNKQAALDVANAVMAVNPTDNELVPLRTQLLQELGKTDEAIKEIEAQIARDPNNVLSRLQYAALLSGTERLDDAIAQYKKIIEIDPRNETALYNLAANYKNKASVKQVAELEKMDKDKNYEPNLSYQDDLKIAADYFETLRRSPKYAADIVVMEQLANCYEVRKETKKVKTIIMEMEGLEERYKDSKEYYRIMEGLYGRNKMLDKMKEAAEKGARL
ncbi:MAG: hypothetical protein EHM43_05310 [Ignavibacteriae bacterium]|nr:MAG: hypothetical protein EHM43_05310 [Ignavibacteriota bacterium]